MDNLKLHFQRFEFKYVISADQEAEIKRRIAPYVVRDPFAEPTRGGAYEVFSLYYDTPGFYYYHEKMDGVERRKKIRLRTYRNSGQFGQYAFFEIKRKHDAVILKDRFVMSELDYSRLIEHDDFYGTRSIRDENRKRIIEEFEWEQHRRSLGPKLLVIYEREPFLGKYNDNFRVTFDKNIRAMENDNLFYHGNDWVDVSGADTIMELKFTGLLPFYISRVIKEFNLERVPYSKYCNAVEACGSLSAFAFPLPVGMSAAARQRETYGQMGEGALGL